MPEIDLRSAGAPGEHQDPRKDSKHAPAEYFIRAVGNAIDILELVSANTGPLSLSEITEKVGQSKSSVFRILCTLEQKGLLERRPGDLFALSQSGFSFKSNQSLLRLSRIAQPLMRELNREFRETISLACLLENHIEAVTVIDSPQRIRVFNVVGGIIPPHASSVGKCIVAHQPETLREFILAAYGSHRFTPHTIVDATVLDEELRKVREQGFAVDREESAMGGICFGAPIWTASDRVGAALSLSLPKDRATDEQKVVDAVQRTAKAISSELVTPGVSLSLNGAK
ncbi:MAG: IclR family transcriptional regulator [Bryobacteraceae bacterium]